MLRRFNEINGKYIEKIYGQDRLAFAISDEEDFYDILEKSKKGGYQGSVIMFYDFSNGKIYKPFENKKNTAYGQPVFFGGYYYFLQGDYEKGVITLYKYLPEEVLEAVTALDMKDVDLYNLTVVGEEPHIISCDEIFKCYYPKAFSFDLDPRDTVCFIGDDKVYIERWIEKGWDDDNDCPSEDYEYYNMCIVRDYNGNVISEERGSLYYSSDGTWWLV